MVLENGRALLYLSSTGFQLYGFDGVASIHFYYPEGTVENANIVDGIKLKSEIEALITSETPKDSKGGEVAVVLAEDIIRQDLISAVTDVFERNGWKTEMRSLPLAVQDVTLNKTLSPDIVRVILGDKGDQIEEAKAIPVVAIEEENEELQKEVVSEQEALDAKEVKKHSLLDEAAAEASRDSSSSLNKIVIVSLLLTLGGALIFVGMKAASQYNDNSSLIKEGATVDVASDISTPTPIPTLTPTPVTTINKNDVSVKVLNGTGVSGQAGRAKTIMEELKYSSVVATSGETKDAKETIIEFTSDIPQLLRDEVVEALDEVFDTVEQKEVEIGDLAITITTGPEE